MNIYNFQSNSVRSQIHRKMRRAMTRGTFELICNRKGRPYLVVKRIKTNKGRIFQFTDIAGKDVTEFMYKALRGEFGQSYPGVAVQSNEMIDRQFPKSTHHINHRVH